MRSVTGLHKIALGLLAAIGLPTAAAAHQLWNIEEVAAQPVPSIVVDGVAVSAAAAGAPTAEAATVQVAFDYLRIGMGYLELPLVVTPRHLECIVTPCHQGVRNSAHV